MTSQPTSQTITMDGVRKTHGDVVALDGVSFSAEPGRVTAFLGPNGAGKSSALRILLGLDAASAGTANFGGVEYKNLSRPLTNVGALFDTVGGYKRRRVRTQLRIVAESNDIPRQRVGEVLELAGVANKSAARLGTLSLGEGQRVGIAMALLGDPQFLVLDEPTNGLDPAGIRWFRSFVKELASGGKTVLLSSHMLSEVEAVADDVVVISRGTIVQQAALADATERIRSLEDLYFALTEVDA